MKLASVDSCSCDQDRFALMYSASILAYLPAFFAGRRDIFRQRQSNILQPESTHPELLPDELATEFGANDVLSDM